MTIFLETKRLTINVPTLDDFEDQYQLQSDPDVMQYVGNGPRTAAEVKTTLEKFITHYQKHKFSLGSVFEKASGAFVGRAGLIYLALDDTQPAIEVGYALRKSYWHKGYATELTKALIKWGFTHLKIDKLVGVTRPENEKSRHVLEKAGMHYVKRTFYNTIEIAYYEINKNPLDFSQIKLIPATMQDYPIILNLARFYAYDISEYYGTEPGWEMEDDGLYEVGIDYKQYWQTPNCFPFLIRYKNELAGFVIVNKKASDPSIDFNMAQFFVLRMYKGKGLGKYIAYQTFNKFPGVWEIMVMPGNEGAYRFWRTIIKDYTANKFEEYTRPIVYLQGGGRNLFRFVSGN